MASLSDKRLARLHKRFLGAAEQFPFLRCGAIQRLDGGHGVSDEEWCGLLHAAPHSAANDVVRLRVLIEGKEWTAGWYFSYLDCDVSHAEFREATKEIVRLSQAAASQFGLPAMGEQCWLPPAMAEPLEARWLAAVLGMRFVKEVSISCTPQHPAFVVRELGDDFFTASARAIEELPPKPGQSEGKGEATPPPSDKTQGEIVTDRAFPQLPPACYKFLMYLERVASQLVCVEDMPPGVWNEDAARLCIHYDLVHVLASPPETKRLPVGTALFLLSARGAACLAEHRLFDNSTPPPPPPVVAAPTDPRKGQVMPEQSRNGDATVGEAAALEVAGADPLRIVLVQSVTWFDEHLGPTERQLDLQRDIPALEEAIQQTPDCALVIVDPIASYMGKSDSHKNAEVRAVLTPVAKLAEKHNVAVLGITHLNKSTARAMDRVMGSIAFVAQARAVWVVGRDRQDQERRLVACLKNNLAKDTLGMAYRLVDVGGYPRVEWEPDPVDVQADDLLAPERADAPAREGKRREADEWLRGLLADGPMGATRVRAEADGAGVPWSAVRAAANRLGIVPYRKGGRDGAWWWALPQRSEVPPSQNVSAFDAFSTFGDEGER